MTEDTLAARSFTHRAAGIDWYCEQRGSGPVIVLVPSGEGDCSSYEQVARLLADSFTVLTFDMPGFSRSSAPPDDEYWPQAAPGQIAELVSSLGIERASFYGCSSGGAFVLGLALQHEAIVRNVMIHEMAMSDSIPADALDGMQSLGAMDDASILEVTRAMAGAFGDDLTQFETYQALGQDYYDRVDRNMVTWIRRYVIHVGSEGHTYEPADLNGRPIDWTIGGLTPAQHFFSNVVLACKAGIPISWLPSRHAPHITIPDALAAHLRATTLRYL